VGQKHPSCVAGMSIVYSYMSQRFNFNVANVMLDVHLLLISHNF